MGLSGKSLNINILKNPYIHNNQIENMEKMFQLNGFIY